MIRRDHVLAVTLALAAGCSTASDTQTAPANIDAIAKADGTSDITVDNWLNASTVVPATLPTPAANYNADNCELYVDQIANANYSGSGTTLSWFDVFIALNPAQPGTITDVGMYTETSDGDKFVTLGNVVSANSRPGYYETGFTYVESSASIDRTAKDYAFFVDVQRDNQLVRLWQSEDGYNYLDAAVFAAPTSTTNSGDTSSTYPNAGSPIYFQKDACE